MLLAKVTAMRSQDPNTQVGACIISQENRVLGLGYNGPPRGVEDIPWERENADPLLTKYPYIVHAEVNAILNANSSVNNGIVYVTLYPCCECTKFMIQSGIKKVVYLANPYKDQWQTKASAHMLDAVGIEVVEFQMEM